jgi:uncharacterized protein YdcH (DUF465 family)
MKQVVSSRGAGSPRGTSTSNAQEQLADAEARHRTLDSRLKELGRRAYLTPTEQREVAELKKHKLLAKDAITELRRAAG